MTVEAIEAEQERLVALWLATNRRRIAAPMRPVVTPAPIKRGLKTVCTCAVPQGMANRRTRGHGHVVVCQTCLYPVAV